MSTNGHRLRDECASSQCAAQRSSSNEPSPIVAASAAAEDASETRRVVVALFHDGFVCRHVTPARANIEGFAQPYDAESSYFLACIENGQLPDGLADMVDCSLHEDGILAEIWDYRGSRTACPLSSVALPQSMPLGSQNRGCKGWKVVLQPSARTEQIEDMFGHFPELAVGELESLSDDSECQLLEGVLPASWNGPVLYNQSQDTCTVLHASSCKEDPGWNASFQECMPVLYQGRMKEHLSSEDELTVTTRSIDESSAYQHDDDDGRINFETNSDAQVHRCEPDTDISSPKCEGTQGFLLTLDKDAFPGLRSMHHLTTSALLSPTEPKKQVVNESQWQKVACQAKKRAIGNDQALGGRAKAANALPNQAKQPQSLGHTEQVDDSSDTPPPLDLEHDTRTRKPDSPPLPTTSSAHEREQEGCCNNLAFYSTLPPLPATQRFLSKLKGKRRRPSFESLEYGMPARLIFNHVGIFFQAATKFERQHAFFLHTNLQRLMPTASPTETIMQSPVGSMNYLASQLGALQYPTDVVDVAKFRQLRHTAAAAAASDGVDWGVEVVALPRRLAGAAAVMEYRLLLATKAVRVHNGMLPVTAACSVDEIEFL
uniref:Uncharacterized protein n=1 Tax=Globisporangium ultimum (strain ATCC 200006 / CBS 805.95 / DAOM BR144) TaxID=431595 RepID=K3WHZ9_GLOUD